MTRIALALAIALSSSAAFAAPDSYNPGTVPAKTEKAAETPKAPKVDPAEQARKGLADWQNKKRSCFTAAGLTENTHFRVDPADQMHFQVNEKVWLGTFNQEAVKKCIAL